MYIIYTWLIYGHMETRGVISLMLFFVIRTILHSSSSSSSSSTALCMCGEENAFAAFLHSFHHASWKNMRDSSGLLLCYAIHDGVKRRRNEMNLSRVSATCFMVNMSGIGGIDGDVCMQYHHHHSLYPFFGGHKKEKV